MSTRLKASPTAPPSHHTTRQPSPNAGGCACRIFLLHVFHSLASHAQTFWLLLSGRPAPCLRSPAPSLLGRPFPFKTRALPPSPFIHDAAEALLREQYPGIAWDQEVCLPRPVAASAGGSNLGVPAMSVARYVARHMPKLLRFFTSTENSLQFLLKLAELGLKDSQMPFTLGQLEADLTSAFGPQLAVPRPVLRELIKWQEATQWAHFSPREHRDLAKGESSPFKGVHQEPNVGGRWGCDQREGGH